MFHTIIKRGAPSEQFVGFEWRGKVIRSVKVIGYLRLAFRLMHIESNYQPKISIFFTHHSKQIERRLYQTWL
jgi:hypothetical protein